MRSEGTASTLEQEEKLEAPPGWRVPELAPGIAGAELRELPALELDTVYYDTADFRLTRRRTALRYRRERPSGATAMSGRGTTLDLGRIRAVVPPGVPPAGPRGVWAVKLSPAAGGAVLVRREVTWKEPLDGGGPLACQEAQVAAGAACLPSGESDNNPDLPLRPPHEVAKFLVAFTLGRPLRPLARLKAHRRRTLVLQNGRAVAEIDEDEVEGSVLLADDKARDQEAVPQLVAWKEVEVEAAAGARRSELDEVVAALVASGARPSHKKSKLATVLASAGLPGGTGDLPAVHLSALGSKATLADLLQGQASACLEALVEHDPPIRLGDPDPEHVHKARVAVRRFRSFLWALERLGLQGRGGARPSGSEAPPGRGSPVFEGAAGPGEAGRLGAVAATWVSSLRGELRWLGAALGTSRDADVRVATLTLDCTQLGLADQPAARSVLDEARSEQTVAHQVLLDVMGTERYLVLLRALEALATGVGRTSACPPSTSNGHEGPSPTLAAPPGELWVHLDVPAAAAMAQFGLSQWRSARRAAKRAHQVGTDEALHRLRIETKRLRYLAEAAVAVLPNKPGRRAAQRVVKCATELQDILGELHDSVVLEQWLRQLALGPAGRGHGGGAAGVAFVAGELATASVAKAAASRKAWGRPWRRLDHKGLAKWAS